MKSKCSGNVESTLILTELKGTFYIKFSYTSHTSQYLVSEERSQRCGKNILTGHGDIIRLGGQKCLYQPPDECRLRETKQRIKVWFGLCVESSHLLPRLTSK